MKRIISLFSYYGKLGDRFLYLTETDKKGYWKLSSTAPNPDAFLSLILIYENNELTEFRYFLYPTNFSVTFFKGMKKNKEMVDENGYTINIKFQIIDIIHNKDLYFKLNLI